LKKTQIPSRKKQKIKSVQKISPSDSCFGSAKELSEDGIGEFSTDNEQVDDHLEDKKKKCLIDQFYCNSKDNAIIPTNAPPGQSSSIVVDSIAHIQPTPILNDRSVNIVEEKLKPDLENNKKQNNLKNKVSTKKEKVNKFNPSNPGPLEAAWNRQEILKRATTTSSETIHMNNLSINISDVNLKPQNGESSITHSSLSNRQPLKNFTDLFREIQ
jgi:hypothetical protein